MVTKLRDAMLDLLKKRTVHRQMVKPLSKVKFNLVRVLSNSAAGRKFFRYRVNVALYRPFLERLGLGVGLGLCSSLRLINAICGSYMVGLALTA